MNLNEQFNNLPTEFIVEMENQKDERWEDVYEFVLDYFGCREDVKEAEADGFPLKIFLKMIHDMGFYGGVNFTLNPTEPYHKEIDY